MKPLATASNHPLLLAYELIFEERPEGGVLMLEKEDLARTFLAKALTTHPDRAQESGASRAELTEKFRELEAAFKLLSEVLGDQTSVVVSATSADVPADEIPAAPLTRRRPRRGWQARPTPELLTRDVGDLSTMLANAARQRNLRSSNAAKAAEADLKSAPPARPAAPDAKVDKRFMLGRFLLKSGHITLRQLVDAVLWQRAQRPRVGEIATEWGIMTKAEVFFVLREKNIDETFCDVAVRLGFLTPFQRLAILARQRRLQSPIGRYFVEQGILEESVVEEAVQESKRQAKAEAALDAEPSSEPTLRR